MGDNNTVDCDMAAASTIEAERDATPSSLESTPEPEADAEPTQEPAQPQKRKGGRKPIYATSEERKQRNRQAQAAFRERRTEYIKQLETTIKQNEENLASLQQSHRNAADECLMLRYKNSLLERILLEKGIDVQAELQMKTGSPVLGPGFMHPAASLPQQSQLQRTALQRQQARRSGSNFLPKLAPGHSGADLSFPTTSPHTHPTPSSHASSPGQLSTRSPALQQGGMTSPASATLAQPQAQHFQNYPRSSQQLPNPNFYQHSVANAQRLPQQRPTPSSTYPSSASAMSSMSTSSHGLPHSGNAGNGSAPSSASFYPSPFQKHFEQLDQEYDTQQSRSMLDEPEDDLIPSHRSPEIQDQFPTQYQPALPGAPQQGGFYQGQPGMTPSQAQLPQQSMPPTTNSGVSDSNFGVDPNDPMLDADPFGLSASMHYPTNYSFEQHQIQR